MLKQQLKQQNNIPVKKILFLSAEAALS